MTDNVPSAHGLLLEGEWSVCASGETSDPNGDAKASNAAVEHVDRPVESIETKDTKEVESEGCERGVRVHACVDEVEVVKPADTPNELMEFIALLIESVDLGSGGVPCICLGAMHWRADNVNGVGC